ncbi:MAG: hypothetical protein FJX45_19610 [Alphaproteobacteria bacterium]|nr:hypothetical protein [Alphaproteobacteria bacterium]MBM3654944.1 hypothetical protein [Alphaproteobacteria bacterium]
MSECHDIPPEAFDATANYLGRGIDDAHASARPEYVTGGEMAEGHYRTGVICGQALRIAELLGESNAAYSLDVATRFLKRYFDTRRSTNAPAVGEENTTPDSAEQPEKPSPATVYASGFEFGRSEALQAEIRRPRETDRPADDEEMLHAVHCAAALAGLATKIADMMGEDNANAALQEAANAVALHCHKKRNAN